MGLKYFERMGVCGQGVVLYSGARQNLNACVMEVVGLLHLK